MGFRASTIIIIGLGLGNCALLGCSEPKLLILVSRISALEDLPDLWYSYYTPSMVQDREVGGDNIPIIMIGIYHRITTPS